MDAPPWGPPWADLGSTWGRLGADLGPTWGQLGAPRGGSGGGPERVEIALGGLRGPRGQMEAVWDRLGGRFGVENGAFPSYLRVSLRVKDVEKRAWKHLKLKDSTSRKWRRNLESGTKKHRERLRSCPRAPPFERAGRSEVPAHIMRGSTLVYIYIYIYTVWHEESDFQVKIERSLRLDGQN